MEFGRASMLRNHELSIDQPERGLFWGWRARHKLWSVDPPEVAKLLHTRDVQLQLHCKQTPENKTKPSLKKVLAILDAFRVDISPEKTPQFSFYSFFWVSDKVYIIAHYHRAILIQYFFNQTFSFCKSCFDKTIGKS